MNKAVLDASAVLAYLFSEAGADDHEITHTDSGSSLEKSVTPHRNPRDSRLKQANQVRVVIPFVVSSVVTKMIDGLKKCYYNLLHAH
jgi:predicted nucleic acid-binding protein